MGSKSTSNLTFSISSYCLSIMVIEFHGLDALLPKVMFRYKSYKNEEKKIDRGQKSSTCIAVEYLV